MRIQCSVSHWNRVKLSPTPCIAVLILSTSLMLGNLDWLGLDCRSDSIYLWLVIILRPTARSSSFKRDNISFTIFLLMEVSKRFLGTTRGFTSDKHFSSFNSLF